MIFLILLQNIYKWVNGKETIWRVCLQSNLDLLWKDDTYA